METSSVTRRVRGVTRVKIMTWGWKKNGMKKEKRKSSTRTIWEDVGGARINILI